MRPGGHTVWSEWEHRGTWPDGSPQVLHGVVIFGVTDGVASWAPSTGGQGSRRRLTWLGAALASGCGIR
jgi:hypothetical protein